MSVKTHFNRKFEYTIRCNRQRCTWLTFYFILYAFIQHHMKVLHHCMVQFEHVFEFVGHNSFYVVVLHTAWLMMYVQ